MCTYAVEWTNFVGGLHGAAAAYLVDTYVPFPIDLQVPPYLAGLLSRGQCGGIPS
jgi:hypothetical protein